MYPVGSSEPSLSSAPECPDEESLQAVAEARAHPTQRLYIERHVDRCASCRRLLSALVLLERSGERSLPSLSESIPSGARPVALSPGAMVGRYRLLRLLGVGGMGVVYLAEDPELDRLVAIKLLRPDLWKGAEADVLQREARAMARLSHPNVVQVYDAGAVDGQLFLAMEYVDGLTLRGWLQERPRAASEILALAQEAGAGLAAAHRAGLVHRDLMPDTYSPPALPRLLQGEIKGERNPSTVCIASARDY